MVKTERKQDNLTYRWAFDLMGICYFWEKSGHAARVYEFEQIFKT